MDDLSFRGAADDPQEPMTMADEWTGAEEIASALMAAEHETKDKPAHIALFRRTFPTYSETMWVVGYPSVRLILVTCPAVAVPGGHDLPGCVREVPVGWRDMASPATFEAKFERVVHLYAGQGWTRQPRGTTA